MHVFTLFLIFISSALIPARSSIALCLFSYMSALYLLCARRISFAAALWWIYGAQNATFWRPRDLRTVPLYPCIFAFAWVRVLVLM